jgi:hypothetical protein
MAESPAPLRGRRLRTMVEPPAPLRVRWHRTAAESPDPPGVGGRRPCLLAGPPAPLRDQRHRTAAESPAPWQGRQPHRRRSHRTRFGARGPVLWWKHRPLCGVGSTGPFMGRAAPPAAKPPAPLRNWWPCLVAEPPATHGAGSPGRRWCRQPHSGVGCHGWQRNCRPLLLGRHPLLRPAAKTAAPLRGRRHRPKSRSEIPAPPGPQRAWRAKGGPAGHPAARVARARQIGGGLG